jgi:hypothetical protein
MTHDNTKKIKSRRTKRQDSKVAKTARYAGKGGRRTPESTPRARRPVDVVRESTGEYGPPQDSPEEKEAGKPVGSTRLFEISDWTVNK